MKKKKGKLRATVDIHDLDINTSHTTVINTRDRLGFTGFIAVIVHAVVILGVSFSIYSRNRVPPTLEVTLAQHADSIAPEKADYLAQHHQEASGTADSRKELTTDKRADFADTAIREVNPEKHKQQEVTEIIDEKQVVSTTGKTDRKLPQKKTRERDEKRKSRIGTDEEDSETSSEIASLQAKLAQQRQQYAKRPRIKTLTSVATRASIDAEYLNLWQEKIELIGNLNYPAEARRQKLYGQLRLLVSLLPDGSVHNVEILQSSGQRILDDAAIRIVRLAAPFAPFPPELRKDVDQLEIIRTWKFEKGDRLTSQ